MKSEPEVFLRSSMTTSKAQEKTIDAPSLKIPLIFAMEEAMLGSIFISCT
jgi:hypothetical protein